MLLERDVLITEIFGPTNDDAEKSVRGMDMVRRERQVLQVHESGIRHDADDRQQSQIQRSDAGGRLEATRSPISSDLEEDFANTVDNHRRLPFDVAVDDASRATGCHRLEVTAGDAPRKQLAGWFRLNRSAPRRR